jgi:NADPH:quinone reductase
MKAIFVVPGYEGGRFEYRDTPVPSPAAGEVLIAIRAAGTNRGELIQRPLLRSSNPALRPMRAGIEFAGEIAALGDSVCGWHKGERVMGRGPGCYAEFTVVNQRALMRMPDGMGFAEAAAIPNVFRDRARRDSHRGSSWRRRVGNGHCGVFRRWHRCAPDCPAA